MSVLSDVVFYLGTHLEGWLNHVGVPLFVSHRRLARRKTLPKALTGWALDSGGFSELSLYGGWRTTPEEYVTAVKRYDREIGQLEWAAPMDMMCEESMLARTGLTVPDHQRQTVANFVRLEQLWRGSDDQWHPESPFMPVLQGGQTPDSYLQCWDMYGEAGVDLSNYPVIGVGSVCRRQHTGEIRDILEAVRDRDPEVPLHGFGVKTRGLRIYGDLLASADSLGWSYNARRNPPLPGCGHASCSNCLKWALRWRRDILAGGCAEHGEPCDGTVGACHQRDLWVMRERATTSVARH
ncbi:deazapurine DNA modification protein DpdA family protein [Mycolicibacterium goodii]|uniref:deazapurine DNA modification protein DpdA family protein n=1 Tax=Mycolicibacterium goodii TaxID=134601 RepID=UPI0027E08E6B|nr:hypothetical protein [Mycolicibacterium goodii]